MSKLKRALIGAHGMQVTIVAKIQSVKDASSGAMMKMVVYDGTGSFNVEHYMPQDDEQVPSSPSPASMHIVVTRRQPVA